MKVNVTFQFDTPEEAIAWQAKVFMPEQKAKPTGPVDTKDQRIAGLTPAAPSAVPVGKARSRGRPPKKQDAAPEHQPSDQGRVNLVRSHQARTTSAAASSQQAAPVSAPAEGDKPQPSGQQAASPVAATAEDVTAALKGILAGPGMESAMMVLQRFGVRRGAEVKPEDRAKFITYAGKVAAREIDPAKGEGLPA